MPFSLTWIMFKVFLYSDLWSAHPQNFNCCQTFFGQQCFPILTHFIARSFHIFFVLFVKTHIKNHVFSQCFITFVFFDTFAKRQPWSEVAKIGRGGVSTRSPSPLFAFNCHTPLEWLHRGHCFSGCRQEHAWATWNGQDFAGVFMLKWEIAFLKTKVLILQITPGKTMWKNWDQFFQVVQDFFFWRSKPPK